MPPSKYIANHPRLDEAKGGTINIVRRRKSFRAFFVFGHLWSTKRISIKVPSGRKRHNVLDAFNGISHELVTVKNDAYVNSFTIIELIKDVCSHYR